jgi:exodeoxyribonuclease VII small subunit
VAKKARGFDFEGAMRELETVVAKMESGELSLEDSLKQFERGVYLTRACQQALTAASQKVQMLSESSNTEALVDFDPPEDTAPDEPPA